jgi:hypothetical protein
MHFVSLTLSDLRITYECMLTHSICIPWLRSFEFDCIIARYQFRDSQKASIQKVRETTYDNFDSTLRARMSEVGLAGKRPEGWLDWIYKNDIYKVWDDYLQAEKSKENPF